MRKIRNQERKYSGVLGSEMSFSLRKCLSLVIRMHLHAEKRDSVFYKPLEKYSGRFAGAELRV